MKTRTRNILLILLALAVVTTLTSRTTILQYNARYWKCPSGALPSDPFFATSTQKLQMNTESFPVVWQFYEVKMDSPNRGAWYNLCDPTAENLHTSASGDILNFRVNQTTHPCYAPATQGLFKVLNPAARSSYNVKEGRQYVDKWFICAQEVAGFYTCTDPDGEDANIKGTTTSTSIDDGTQTRYTDTCAGNTLYERLCAPDGTIQTRNYNCGQRGQICYDGRCANDPTACQDDPGCTQDGQRGCASNYRFICTTTNDTDTCLDIQSYHCPNGCAGGQCLTTPPCTPATETCNGVDDDCDGSVDEGCAPPPPGCTPATETCNGVDDDCDGSVDEDCAQPPPGSSPIFSKAPPPIVCEGPTCTPVTQDCAPGATKTLNNKKLVCREDGTWEDVEEEGKGVVGSINKAFGWPADSKNGLYVLLGGAGFLVVLLLMPRGGTPK